MEAHTPYTSKLHNSEDYRVVRISAGRWHDPLRCKLIDRRLDDADGELPYRALSYVWGSSSVTDTIKLQDLPFQITLNLSCALRHLRRVDGEILLWVDALCINQQDHKERGLQVSIMQSIYRNAQEVVVFMGDGRGHRVNRSHWQEPHASPMTRPHGYERNKLSFTEMLNAPHSSGSRKLAPSLPAATCVMGLISLFSDEETVEEGCNELMKLSPKTRCHIFEHLRAFATCPWWSRIWVVQEIAVGTAVAIQYGTITLPWEALVATANVWSLQRTVQVAVSAGIEPENVKVFALFANQLTGLEQTRRKWHAEGGADLLRILQEFSHRQASDDRDKVYGLLSLARHGREMIRPDYALDVFGTYRDTALALIKDGSCPACWVGDQKRKYNKGLPSWIPDWSTAVDNGDKRRMGLFDSYGAKCGWTVRVIESEMHYWATVEDEMERLMNSLAGQRLPIMLKQVVLDYIALLTQRSKSLVSEVDAGYARRWKIDRLILDCPARQGVTLQSTLNSLEWCESHNIIPRSGKLLQNWIRDLKMSLNREPTEQAREQWADETLALSQTQIGEYLRSLDIAVGEGHLDMHSRMRRAHLCLERIQDIYLEAGRMMGPTLSLTIDSVIRQCRRLVSLCNATESAISPSKLFKFSYSLRGTALWLTGYQCEREDRLPWSTGFSPCDYAMAPDNMLAMQMVVVDSVTVCGSRQFGWSDTKSALATLISWLDLSCSTSTNWSHLSRHAIPNPARLKKMNSKPGRMRQFAKTIIGGRCRRDGAYQETDETTLGTVEDWLRDLLRSGGSVVPPSPLFEDIQVATDGRVFFVTDNGSMGLGPASIQNEDSIHILPSGGAHFVLRSKLLGREAPNTHYPAWMGSWKPDQYEIIGDCYLHTDSALDERMATEEEPAVEGSLPFEWLGARYFEEMGLPKREVVMLV